MKHRSVIAFVIVAAGLFALPQLSHELQSFKGAVGSRLHRELLQAFLNLPAGAPTAAPASAGHVEPLLASCGTRKSGAPAAKGGRGEAGGRAEGRSTGKTVEQRAMIGDPANDPINNKTVAMLPEVESEVAMIIPPGSGIDPRTFVSTLKAGEVARVEADGLRAAYTAAARSGANAPEWQKAAGDVLRTLNAQPGAPEFRFVRDGKQVKARSFKCVECPAPAPRLTRLPRQVALSMPLPAPSAPAETSGE